MTDEEAKQAQANVMAMLTAWRADDLSLFVTLANESNRHDLAAALGMLSCAITHLARQAGAPPEEYMQKFALYLAA